MVHVASCTAARMLLTCTGSKGIARCSNLLEVLFAIFVDDIVKKVRSVNTGCYVSHVCTSIFLYADVILLLAPSVSSLQKLLSACEEELYFLDMRINDKKSVCIRFGNRHDVCCAPVTTCSDGALRWVDTCRYLGIY